MTYQPNTPNFPTPYRPGERAIRHTDPRVRIDHTQQVHYIRADIPWDRVAEFSSVRGGDLLKIAIPAGAWIHETMFIWSHEQHHREHSSSGDKLIDKNRKYNDVPIADIIPFDCGGPATAVLQLDTSNGVFDIIGGAATSGPLNLNGPIGVYDGDRAYCINDNFLRLTIDFGGPGGEPTQGHGTFMIGYIPRNTTDEQVV